VHGTISGIIGGAILGALLVLPYSHSSIVLIIRDIFVGAMTGGFMFGMNFGIVGAIFGNIIRNYQTNRKINGYLVCNKCGAYYELKEGESPDDFTDECDCGGKLQHKKSLKTPMKFSIDKKVLLIGIITTVIGVVMITITVSFQVKDLVRISCIFLIGGIWLIVASIFHY
jgi:hypothetical protein